MNDISRNLDTHVSHVEGISSAIVGSTIIPKSFMLAGIKVDVVVDNTLAERKKVLGEARYCEQLILLDTSAGPLQTIEQAFLHELIHWIFYIMHEDDMRNNERIVDLLSHLLHQALMTSEKPQVEMNAACIVDEGV